MKVGIFITGILSTLLYCFLAICPAIAQTNAKPLIQVEQMDYVYDPQIEGTTGTRVILPTDKFVADQMKQSLLNALEGRWNAAVQHAAWNFKRINPIKNSPKFKPNLKSNQPGTWHLFFQVFDNGPYPITSKKNWFVLPPSFESLDKAPYSLHFKAEILDGANGAIVFSNDMYVELRRTALPDNQMLLRKVPAMTSSFLHAFDSAIKVFFDTSRLDLLKLPIAPAFVFIQFDSTKAKAVPLAFRVTGDTLVEEPNLRQQWVIRKVSSVKLDKQERFGSNLLGGTFTALTGIGTDRVKVRKYLANIDYYDNYEYKTYQCKVTYLEEQREERSREKIKNADGTKSYETNVGNISTNRYIDQDHYAYFLAGTDTVGSFKMKFGVIKDFVDQFTQCWDGRDSTSITNMPEYWNNTSAVAGMGMAPVYMEGSLYGKSFVIQTSKGGNQYDLLISEKLMATLNMNYDRPSRGLLYSVPEDMRMFKAMCMLASMPFRYFY